MTARAAVPHPRRRRPWPVPGAGVPAPGSGDIASIPPPRTPPTLWSPAPIFGFRFWRVHIDGLFGSTGVRWERPVLEAECRNPRGLRLGVAARGLEPVPFDAGEPVPHLECTCGIYAIPDVTVLVGLAARAMGPGVRALETGAFGIVAMTGRVVEHERGWRAARAEVTALLVLTQRWFLLTAGSTAIERIFADPVGGLASAERRPLPDGRPQASSRVRFELAQRLTVLKRAQEERWTSESRSA